MAERALGLTVAFVPITLGLVLGVGQRYELPPFTFVGPRGLTSDTPNGGLCIYRPHYLELWLEDESTPAPEGKSVAHHYNGFAPGHGGRDHSYTVRFGENHPDLVIYYRTHYDEGNWIASLRSDWWAWWIAQNAQLAR